VPSPHGLRHQAITRALDLGRDLRDVAKFSRHRDVRTLMIYDDSRRDVGGDIAKMLGD
jgi:integrase/recombinase XerC